MLKALLSVIPTNSMTCFKLPASLCKSIQSQLTRFWWDSNTEIRKICWVSWKRITKSKREGGLGLRDIQSFNDALLAKLSWRILKNAKCLLAKILLGKYCQDKSFLEVPVSSNTSHGWRGILIGRDFLLKQLGKTIGNGKETSLWNDPWLSLTSPKKPMGPPNQHTKDWLVSS
ncbi:uncharacterized protein LOC112088828 [Eutrema salsugineum]|uniref:uncharacterized protein LOC112088828 n=1 Tax=Eutrema salsugineum TaxID=72664 RepID=UPI000CED5894|nr:uncharacterized protein LOC112088828 [Eutrema salsugineum]